MTISCSFTKVFDSSAPDNLRSDPGIIMQTDGSLLAGLTTDFSQPVTQWLRSTNHGLTWTPVGTIPGNTFDEVVRGCGQRPNGAIAHGEIIQLEEVEIYTTTNNGGTWTQTANFQKLPGATQPVVNTVAATSFNRNKAIVVGRFNTTSGGPDQHYVTSDDAGQTWNDGQAVFSTERGSWGTAIHNMGAGVWLMGSRNSPGYGTYGKLAKTTDAGVTWSTTITIPLPANTLSFNVHAFASWNNGVVLMAIGASQAPSQGLPYLFRSTDAGDTWALVARSAITSWPTDTHQKDITEVARLPGSAAILQFRPESSDTTPPWRLSNDFGATWPIVPTIAGGSLPQGVEPTGAIVMALDGSILATLAARNGSNPVKQIWRGTIQC
jgi:hypothetical protein